MSAQSSFDLLKSLANTTLQELSKNIIIKKKNNYIVFEQYSITPDNSYFIVFKDDKLVHDFSNSRNALAWCIFDKYRRNDEAAAVKTLDRKLKSTEFDLAVAKNIINKTQDINKREIMIMKAENSVVTRSCLRKQLTERVGLAKYFQQQGFIKHETARVINTKKIIAT